MTKPAPIALVVCDSIYSESKGKTALIGLFNRVIAASFPATHAQLCVYASVTEVRADSKFKLDIVHSESDHPVVSLKGRPSGEVDPLTICDFNFELHNVVFPEPGLYFIRFWGDEYLLLQRPFQVVQAKSDEGKNS
jgi:hypothetical protein